MSISLIVLLGFLILLAWILYPAIPPFSTRRLLKHLAQSPNHGGIYAVKNGEVVLDKHCDSPLPLASTVKIVIAVEFSQQVAQGKLDQHQAIPLDELAKFYLPKTDGGAHPAWLKAMRKRKLIESDAVPLFEIARGMIEFSSNANTEYLMMVLGLDNINQQIERLSLSSHEPLYPIVSCILVLRDLSEQALEAMTKDSYIQQAFAMHEKVKQGEVELHITLKQISAKKQARFSDWLPRASAKGYVRLMQLINRPDPFTETEQVLLHRILALPGGGLAKGLLHAGEKSGSTNSILTNAMYETKQNGDTTEMAVFLNELTSWKGRLIYFALLKLQADVLTGKNLEKYQMILKSENIEK